MHTYAITYSYPTWDRNYRGQRGCVVRAKDEAHALRLIREDGASGYDPCPGAEIVRAKIVDRKGA